MKSKQFTPGRSIAAAVCAMVLLTLGAVGTRASAGQVPKTSSPNSEARLTDAQRNQLYKADWLAFQSHYRSWLANLNLSSLSLSSLARGELTAVYAPPQAMTLAEAVSLADEVVVGTATGFQPTPFDGTFVTLRITHTFKGNVSNSVHVHQAGGLLPTGDWTGVTLVDAVNAPLMLPGDRFLLLLQRRSTNSGVEYDVQSFTGMYKLESGRLVSLPGIGPRVTGTNETGLSALVGTALAGG